MRRKMIINMADGKRIVIPNPKDMIITVRKGKQNPITYRMNINRDSLTGVDNPFIRRIKRRR